MCKSRFQDSEHRLVIPAKAGIQCAVADETTVMPTLHRPCGGVVRLARRGYDGYSFRALSLLASALAGKHDMASTPITTVQKPRYSYLYDDPSMYILLGERPPLEMMQARPILYVTIAVHSLIDEDVQSVFIESNIPIRTNPNNLRDGAAPDLCRSRNVDAPFIYNQTGYNLWEVGKPPEFVLEVASESTYENDLYEKPGIYAAMGIDEYWMFDPTRGDLYGQALTGFKLVDGEYEAIEITPNEHGLMSGYSEELGVRLCAVDESRRKELLSVQPELMRVFELDYNPAMLLLQNIETGVYLLNVTGLNAALERAETERDAERIRAEQAEARIQELEERLRRQQE